jgi:predicted  nucleic acid-binding Zn-ribbon protein
MGEQAVLSDEKDERAAERARLKDEREMALIGISATEKQNYDSMRQRKRGVAVALLKDNICTACGMAPSAARIQQARKGSELVKCGNCARIMYVK